MFDLMNDQEEGDTKEGGAYSYQGVDYDGGEEDSFAVISESVGQQATVAHSYDLGQSTDEESETEDVYEVSEPPEQDTECEYYNAIITVPSVNSYSLLTIFALLVLQSNQGLNKTQTSRRRFSLWLKVS